jgi:hypothetical protein
MIRGIFLSGIVASTKSGPQKESVMASATSPAAGQSHDTGIAIGGGGLSGISA